MKEVNYAEYRASDHGCACEECSRYWSCISTEEAREVITRHARDNHPAIPPDPQHGISSQ